MADMAGLTTRLFLVGCPRSGTTLLQSLLAAHPAVFSVPESHLYPQLLSPNRVLRRLGVARRDAPQRFSGLLSTLGLPAATPRGVFVRFYLQRLAQALDEATLAAGKTVWLEKTPRHLYYVADVARALPDAKFIHLLRGGSDVVASLYEVTRSHPEVWGGARSIDSCIARWVKDVGVSRRYLGHPDHFVLHYEALTRDPETCLRELFAFVGVPFEASVLTDYRQASSRVVAPGEAWKAAVQGDIKTAPSRKTIFTLEEQAYIRERTRLRL